MPTSNQPFTVPQSYVTGTKVPQTLPELLALYKAKEEDANLDLSGADDPRTRPGLEIRKNGATQALPGLKAELLRLVEQNAGAVFLSGTKEGVESFIGAMQDVTEGAVVMVDAGDMYNFLATGTERGLRRDRRFSMDCLNAWVDSVIKLLDILQVDGIPAPNLTGYLNQVFPDTASMVAVVRRALNELKAPNGVSVGDGLNAIYLQVKAAEEAIKEGVATPFLPVIVLNATPEETDGHLFKALFFGRNVAFEAKDTVTEGNIQTVIKKLKQARRGERQNKGA